MLVIHVIRVNLANLVNLIMLWDTRQARPVSHHRPHPEAVHLGGQPVTDQRNDQFGELREDFPSWRFGTVWSSAASGPDRCRLTAYREGVSLSAWNAAELAEKLRHEETRRRESHHDPGQAGSR
jgi:hypothetical protein